MTPSLNTSILPQNVVNCMSPEDRLLIGRKSVGELRYLATVRDERALQKQVASYLRLLNVWFAQSRMDRRTSNTVGTPDFVFCYNRHFVAWEVKCPRSQNLRPEQAKARDGIIAQGGEWRLITSLAEAQAHLRELDGNERGEDHGNL